MPKQYLPFAANEHPVTAQGDAAQAFATLWLQVLPPERRAKMRADSRLMACANAHAIYLASRTPEQIAALPSDGHGSHVGLGGTTPNQRVRLAGYRLPISAGDGNTVEFNAHTHRGPERALALLLGSDAHRPAVLGEGYWEDATFYGFGQAGNDYVTLFCVAEAEG